MLKTLRPFMRIVAIAVLIAAPTVFLHSGQDDFACAPGAAEGDSPSIGRDRADTPQHCLICHWTRALRPHVAAPLQIESALTAGVRVEPSSPTAHRAPALDRLPARAPPAVFRHA